MPTTVGRARRADDAQPSHPRDRTCNTARVKNFLIRVAVNGVALWVAALVVDGIHLGEDGASLGSNVLSIVLVALLFGVINAFIKPVVKLLSLPFIILTLGLFTFLVNAFMLQITEWIADPLGLAFTIDEFFWDAVLAALVITLVSWVLNVILPDDD
jgi:putative membrane protein